MRELVRHIIHGIKESGLEFIEISQFAIIMFLVAIVICIVVSSLFTQIDKYNLRTYEEDSTEYRVALSFTLLFQIIILTYMYYKSVLLVKSIKSYASSVSHAMGSKYKSHKTIESGLHIVLILLLKEMNSSLNFELKEFSKYILIEKLDLNSA